MRTKIYFSVACALLTLGLSQSVYADDVTNKSPTQSTAPAQASATTVAPASAFPEKEVQRFATALEIIKNYYVTSVDDKKLFEDAIRGVLNGLDPHSSYLDEDDLNDLNNMTKGEFSGVGIEVIPYEGYLKVVSPVDDSPAQKAGVKPGDIILRINDVLVKNMSMREAIDRMRGKKGTKVVLTIARKDSDKPLKFVLARDDIQIRSVTSRMLENGYGYIRISSFQDGTAQALEDAVATLKKETNNNLKGVVLDLRNNPGGLLDSAVKVSDDFLDPSNMGANKLVVYTKSNLPESRFMLYAKPGDILNGAPLVVLINEGSASGAEIVAGALQDHKRATIVGTNSFGKGSVQTVIPLDAGSALKLTTALYFTPNGRSIQASGIRPDIVVEDLRFSSIADNDQDLDAIKEADLKGHLANGNGNNADTKPDLAPTDLGVGDPGTAALAKKDYQLFEAFNILKTMTVLKKGG